jgi:hypothetical protein
MFESREGMSRAELVAIRADRLPRRGHEPLPAGRRRRQFRRVPSDCLSRAATPRQPIRRKQHTCERGQPNTLAQAPTPRPLPERSIGCAVEENVRRRMSKMVTMPVTPVAARR